MSDYQKYESMKYEWIRANPAATPEQYQQAMRKIAEKCGV